MSFKVKEATARELVLWIMQEALTTSQAQQVLESWLEAQGYKKQDAGEQYNIEVPKGREHLIKFCPICGAELRTVVKVGKVL